MNEVKKSSPVYIREEIQKTFAIMGAQLIIVAHAAHGVSVNFFNWEEFFPIEYM